MTSTTTDRTTSTAVSVQVLRPAAREPQLDECVSNSNSLERLLAAVVAGDQQAFAELYRYLAGPVRSRAFGIIRCFGMADEIVQEVFLEIWRKASTYDPDKGAVTTWIWQITRARSIDRIRVEESRRRLDHYFSARHAPDLDTTGDALFARIEREEITRALDSLSEPQRDVILACYYRGLTHLQVSRELALPLGTAKSRIRDALIKLREILLNQP